MKGVVDYSFFFNVHIYSYNAYLVQMIYSTHKHMRRYNKVQESCFVCLGITIGVRRYLLTKNRLFIRRPYKCLVFSPTTDALRNRWFRGKFDAKGRGVYERGMTAKNNLFVNNIIYVLRSKYDVFRVFFFLQN